MILALGSLGIETVWTWCVLNSRSILLQYQPDPNWLPPPSIWRTNNMIWNIIWCYSIGKWLKVAWGWRRFRRKRKLKDVTSAYWLTVATVTAVKSPAEFITSVARPKFRSMVVQPQHHILPCYCMPKHWRPGGKEGGLLPLYHWRNRVSLFFFLSNITRGNYYPWRTAVKNWHLSSDESSMVQLRPPLCL